MIAGMTIGRKLALGVGVSLASLVILSVAALRVTAALGDSLDSVVNGSGHKLDLIVRTRQSFKDLKSSSLRAQIAYAIAEMNRHSTGAAKGTCAACHAPSSP